MARRLLVALFAFALAQCIVIGTAKEGDVTVEEDADFDSPGEQAEASGADKDKTTAFVDSAKELQEKLAQLQSLLDKKGEGADPALKERLAGLQAQLGKLGLGMDGEAAPGGDGVLSEFLGGCLAMSMRRLGVRRPATLAALRRLPSLTQDKAADLELVRFTATCINDLSEDELKAFRNGKLQVLPKAIADKASEPEAKSQVLQLEATLFRELQHVATTLAEQLGGEEQSSGLPMTWGLLAAVPVIGMVGFLAKKFLDLQKEKDGKKDKVGKKKSK